MKDNKPKISIVGYLNTKPFIFGLIKSQIWEQIELSMEIPSVCAMNFKKKALCSCFK